LSGDKPLRIDQILNPLSKAAIVLMITALMALLILRMPVLTPAILGMDNTSSTNSTAQQFLANQLISSYQTTFLAVLSIAACLICIWLVFIFGRSLQLSASLRGSLVDSVSKQEFEILERDLLKKAKSGPLDPNDPAPKDFGDVAQLYPNWEGPTYSWLYSPSFPSTNEEQVESEAERVKRIASLQECQDWEKKEKQRFAKALKEAEEEAKEKAEEKVPKSMDISLLGGGFSFLLEFSAVIVIIFTLLTLGILNVLEGKDITTILASIAGYVLGKAQAGAAAKKDEKTANLPEAK
jgi:hypothetical protein